MSVAQVEVPKSLQLVGVPCGIVASILLRRAAKVLNELIRKFGADIPEPSDP